MTEPDTAHPATGERPADPDAQASSALAEALALVGDRWTLQIVGALLEAPLRFGALQERLPQIAPNVLSQRLRALDQGGLIVAEPYSQRPPRFDYALSERGRELAGAVRLLADWGTRHGGGQGAGPRHAACGGPLETRWYCPACEEVVEPGGDEALYYA